MHAGIVALIAAYVLSQFYRAFLAVLTPVLGVEIGAGPDQLALASGLWFLAFALMQPVVGWCLDHIGPRRTASGLLAVAALGAAVFGQAQGPMGLYIAMLLIGAGCSAVLMSSYYIFARRYAPALFGTLAGMVVGVGSLGNLAASLPLSLAVGAVGWRGAMWALAGVTLAVAATVLAAVRDPARVEKPADAPAGGLRALIANPALWPILVMMVVCYAPTACLRGLWVGPYLRDVYADSPLALGRAALVMGLAMVLGNFVYGPAERFFGTRKGVVLVGNLVAGGLLLLLALWPAEGRVASIAALAAIGFFGSSFPMVIAHGRALFPAHLVGRGVTWMNMFGIGAAGLLQAASGPLVSGVARDVPSQPYAVLFASYGVLVILGSALYATSRDRMD